MTIDFEAVSLTPQSFVGARLSALIRDLGPAVLDMITFANCNETVHSIVMVVTQYTQAGLDTGDPA